MRTIVTEPLNRVLILLFKNNIEEGTTVVTCFCIETERLVIFLIGYLAPLLLTSLQLYMFAQTSRPPHWIVGGREQI